MTSVLSLGLVGKSLAHSASPRLFAQMLGDSTAFTYTLFELPTIDLFPDLLRKQPKVVGLNVTVPYKKQVLRFVDKLEPAVLAVGATNTLLMHPNLGVCAFNTDIVGAAADLQRFSFTPELSRVLVLGTGGAAHAVAYTLYKDFNAPEVELASRSPKGRNQIGYQAANERLMEYQLIINATPLGMYPATDALPALDYTKIGAQHCAWDLVYNPEKTAFLRACAAQGATIRNGWGMLCAQAEASLAIWQGKFDAEQLLPNPWQTDKVVL